jgi:hypothetical protein
LNVALRGYEQQMASPRLLFVLLLTAGVPFGLLKGLLEGGWDGGELLSAVVVGAIVAITSWFLPTGPHGVTEETWDAISRSQRRAVLEALSRGEPLPDTLHPWTAARLEREIDEKPRTWLDRAQAALLLAAFAAVLIESADRGAPAGWIAAGCVSCAIWLAIGIYIRLPRGRRAAVSS